MEKCMRKVILNKCYGCFNVSPKGYNLYAKKINKNLYFYRGVYDELKNHIYIKEDLDKFIKNEPTWLYAYSFEDYGDKVSRNTFENSLILDESLRFDPILIEVVEELGYEANGRYSELRVIEIPDDVAEDYMIDNYDGIETLHKRVELY